MMKFSNYICIIFSLFIFLKANGERTKDKMYEQIEGTAACFRRLNSTHQTGCTSDRSGTTGVIHMVEDESDLEWALSNGTAAPYVVVMPLTMMTQDVARAIAGSPERVSGVVLHRNSTVRPSSWSAESSCPNAGYGLKDTCTGRPWNPPGTGLLHEDLPFPMFLLPEDGRALERIDRCFRTYNERDPAGQPLRSLCALELGSFMFAAVDAPTCVRRARLAAMTTFTPVNYCEPLGDRNVWLTTLPWTNDIEDVLIVAARTDTTSLFYEVTPGAESAVTGLVTLMTTARVLANMRDNSNVNRSDYRRNVLFVIFNGESYDYIGSQRFVYDVRNGHFPMERDDVIKNQLRQMNMSDVKLVAELGQISNASRLFVHRTARDDPTVDGFKDKLAANGRKTGVEFGDASNGGRLPPASIQSFLEVDGNVSALLITDHDGAFTNPYYNSVYDDVHHLGYGYVNETDASAYAGTIQRVIADVATTLALSLFEEATGRPYDGPSSSEDALYVANDLLRCYLDTANCDVFRAALYKDHVADRPLGLYVSVKRSQNVQTSLTAYSLAWLTGERVNRTESQCVGDLQDPVYQYMWMSAARDVRPGVDPVGANGSSPGAACYRSTVNYTLALSPAFEIDGYDWSSGRYSTWTESIWQELSMRMYLQPSTRHELVTISIGTVTLLLSMALVYTASRRLNVLFPPQGTAPSPASC